MLIKNNKIIKYLILILFCTLFTNTIYSDELNITAKIINVDKDNEIINAEGTVVAIDQDGNKIESEKAEYKKKLGIFEATGSVILTDIENNKLISDKIKYFQKNKVFHAYTNSRAILNEGYEVFSDSLVYDSVNKIVNSNEYSKLIDMDGNTVDVDMFNYSFIKKIFSSKGKIKIIDRFKNKFFFNEMYVDTEKHRIVGTDARVSLNPDNIEQATSENDPRFVANTAIITKHKSVFKKGVYTQCKRNANNKCPGWQMRAKTITHDKEKKTIYYDNSTLRLFDIPVFYFPKFFHPDPTVSRQSGFLSPTLNDSSTLGVGLRIPYFFALDDNKDFTFTPKLMAEDHNLYFGEYRHVTDKSSLILDTSYSKGYEKTSSKRTPGSRSHFYMEALTDLDLEGYSTSDLNIKIQKSSNDTFLRVHDINTKSRSGLVDSGDTILDNKIMLDLKKEEMTFNVTMQAHEQLRTTGNNRYEFIAPEINFENLLHASDKVGDIRFNSRAYYRNYDVDKTINMLTNTVLWNSRDRIGKKGYVTEFQGIFKNNNYDTENTTAYKNDTGTHEISGALSVTKSLPMEKRALNTIKTFTPKVMLRYAPGHMRNLNDSGTQLTATNLFSLIKTSENDVVESGTSTILGFDYSIDKLDKDDVMNRKLSFSGGQVFSAERNSDMPDASSLDDKVSSFVGDLNLKIFTNSSINYKFNLDQNLSTLNYNEITGNFNFGKIDFLINYLEEQDHIGTDNYANAEMLINLSNTNSLSFKTRKNFQTDATEFYKLNYQYENDCLRAGIDFNREFYTDKDVEPNDTIRITIAIIPYQQIDAPIDQSIFK